MARPAEFPVLTVALALLACGNASREQAGPAPGASARSAATNVAVVRAGPTPCEISYEQTKAAIEANPFPPSGPVGPPGTPPARIELAPKDVYLRDCQQMPAAVQQCLVYQYAMEHREECTRARAEYDNPRTTLAGDK